MNPTIQVAKEGKMKVSATPWATFGNHYYCSIGWTAACAEGRTRGPVAPEGHPQRVDCEAQFLEQPCPTFSMAKCGSSDPGACPITFDTYFVIDGKNVLHPDNARNGCLESTYVFDGEGHILSGQWWIATAHGSGSIKACNVDGSVCGVSPFVINQRTKPPRRMRR